MSAPLRLALLAPLTLLGGCLATQRDMLELGRQTDILGVRVQELRKTLNSLQGNQADLSAKLDQMQREIGVFTEALKDNQDSMSRLSAKMDDLGAALGSKVSSINETLSQQKRLLEREEESRKAAEEDRLRREREAAQALTPGEIYRNALIQLNQKQYDLAEQGFALYLQKYPQGEVADLALSYLGQALGQQKKWPEAARQYALLLDRFPKSDLVPSARLKYALCLIEMKSNLEEARRYLESVPEDFPRSPEADAARQALKTLAPPPKPTPAKPR